ncbi:MAG: glutamate dehydrogenase (NAD(P)+), partial [Arenicella sp.]
EWVKNIGHIRFGRLQRRQEERKTNMMVKAIEEMVGKPFPVDVLEEIVAGATELDLVRSGLDDTMRQGYQVISEKWHSDDRIPDLRIAAMMISLERIVDSYKSLGI